MSRRNESPYIEVVDQPSRRDFLGRALAGTALLAGGLPGLALAEPPKKKRTATDWVTLGGSKLKVTRLGMGTGSFGGRDQRNLGVEGLTKLVHYAYDQGIRFIDTADSYRIHGMVKKAIADLPRDKLIIQSKLRWAGDPDVKAALDRFRKELGVEYFDSLMIHCTTKAKWPKTLERMRDELSEAKEKGIIRNHGVTCHGLPALREVAGCGWVDINQARINHTGFKMDGDTGDWKEMGKVPEACSEIEKIHAAGKGVIGMKIIGNGSFTKPEEREKSIRFVMSRKYVDAVVIGFKSPAEIDEAIKRMNAALAV